FAEFEVATPGASRAAEAEIALSPAQRAAMIYALDPDTAADTVARSLKVVGGLEGVDLAMWRSDGEAIVRGRRGELRFRAGGDLVDARGESWSVDGELAVLRAEIQDGRILSTEYPDALARVWSALHCPNAGDVLLSAAPGYEFVDWGGSDHVGGGSHGSLHRSDSLGALLWCGTGPDSRAARDQWSLRDIAPMIRGHFGVPGSVASD
ncbi:MAG: alkaline phosphatase family protein, partial [Solirubrobacteraceae bacterium]